LKPIVWAFLIFHEEIIYENVILFDSFVMHLQGSILLKTKCNNFLSKKTEIRCYNGKDVKRRRYLHIHASFVKMTTTKTTTIDIGMGQI